MVTIEDIAKYCSLSPETVSEALKGAPDISLTVRDLVRKAAMELGYLDDNSGPANTRTRSWTICVLCHDKSEWGVHHYLFSSIIESFRSAVERHGYDIVLLSEHWNKKDLSYYGHCRYRKADGVLIVTADYHAKETMELIESDLPKIAIDYSDARIGCVTTNSEKSMALLYNHLYDLGHRRIVYMHGEKSYITEKRIAGLKAAMAEKGEIMTPGHLISSTYYSIKGGYESMHALLLRPQRPTAVIASDDYSAIGAIQAAKDLRLSIPQDISLVGYDGIEITQCFTPRLTTIRQDTKGMGIKAAENLIKQILRVEPSSGPDRIVLEPQLLIGDSTTRI